MQLFVVDNIIIDGIDKKNVMIQLFQEGESTFRHTVREIDLMQEYSKISELTLEEAIKLFRDLQLKYFGKILNNKDQLENE